MDPAPDAAGQAADARVVRTHNDILRATLQLLLGQGWEAVTHPNVAREAGYSRATVYNHWPTRNDLLRDAFNRVATMPHQPPSGDLRHDLIAELTGYRDEMQRHRLDRALAVLVDLTASNPDMIPVRDKLVADGEQLVRDRLAPLLSGPRLDAAVLMLCGAVLQQALMHGELPSDEVITASVDLTLRAIDATGPDPA
ncbi:MAG TPA: TetR/AcrR family transcriptional regulator [Pseudonocardia sp.]